MDQRQAALAQWAADQIDSLFDQQLSAELDVVSGDASFRRYFRMKSASQSWICVDAPPEKENSRQFVDIARQWFGHDVHVPEVLAFDEGQGFMLLSDFGDVMLHPLLNEQTADDLYGRSLDALLKIQQMPVEEASAGGRIPDYDAELLDREMELFRDWLCQQHLQLELTDQDHQLLDDVFARLRESALQQPQVVVHRDYHSRNLMVCHDETIGIIDFQDAVFGPVTYDLVSLLKDCYIAWPAEQVQNWASEYHHKLQQLGLYQESVEKFLTDFNRMGMQRHLKAAGIFARLRIRDGKHGYLLDVPRTCDYLLHAARQDEEFTAFADWMEQRFLPALAAHSENADVIA